VLLLTVTRKIACLEIAGKKSKEEQDKADLEQGALDKITVALEVCVVAGNIGAGQLRLRTILN
jgi:hypothetical protein